VAHQPVLYFSQFYPVSLILPGHPGGRADPGCRRTPAGLIAGFVHPAAGDMRVLYKSAGVALLPKYPPDNCAPDIDFSRHALVQVN